MIRALLLPVAGLAFAGCALDITTPASNVQGLPAGLEVHFAVDPGEVGQHEPFTAHLSVTNVTSGPIQVSTAHGCLAVPAVRRDGQRFPFQGSGWACTAAFNTHTFAPGETKSFTWNMRAELHAQGPGEIDGAPAPEGTYSVQAEFDVVSKSGQRPTIASPLEVR